MAGCGYVCPLCEGKGVMDSGAICDYCSSTQESSSPELSDSDWIEKVHGGNCCSDLGESNSSKSDKKDS